MAEDEKAPPIQAEHPKPSRSLVDWFALNPRFGLVGTMASVIGIPLCLLLFFLAQKDRDIRYITSASPTTIVKNGQSSNLRVYYEGKELTSDVTSVQISIWNAGRESVKRENILSNTVIMKLDPPSRILEARVKNVTSRVLNFQLDVSGGAQGILNCSWDIFEPGDGVLLEVFYAGTAATIISEGVIEGKIPIRRARIEGEGTKLPRWGITTISILAVLMAFMFVAILRRAARPIVDQIFGGLISCVIAWMLMVAAVSTFQNLFSYGVPFAF